MIGGIGKHPVGFPMNQTSLGMNYRFENPPVARFMIGGRMRFVGDQVVYALDCYYGPGRTISGTRRVRAGSSFQAGGT